ncbi:unnamed protein product [Adineta steineri]|uniref:Uncharacterized protein n=1 Tax=Adineta steineri TaxID=433720 RepID=A0A818R9H3_9BILA|nr:unnamed protein product [Adineta steineri]CAF1177856.1 unnamed protein product [Adineta steineri]CAF3541060.1 unnamed protein product [Adineta steineri]CAF3654104.1 unnamed protein product [Adineta steineri]
MLHAPQHALIIYAHGTVPTCTGSSSGSSSYIDAYTSAASDVLGVGAIVAIVAGSLSGLGVFIATIVVLCILAKRKKRARIWAIQAQQQAMNQSSIISGIQLQQQQQWPPTTYQYPYVVTTNYVNPQYSPPYSLIQAPKI